MQRIKKILIVTTFLIPSFSLVLASTASASGDLNNPTKHQLECRKSAKQRPPKHVVIAFEGWKSYDSRRAQYLRETGAPNFEQDLRRPLRGALLRGMLAQGAMQVNNLNWYYYDEADMNGKNMSDAVRCAYEYLTTSSTPPHLTVMGFSFGGHAAYQFSTVMKSLGLHVDLAVTADPRTNPSIRVNWSVPTNVKKWINFYQTNSLLNLRGYPVKGAENIDITHLTTRHMGVPMLLKVRQRIITELDQL